MFFPLCGAFDMASMVVGGILLEVLSAVWITPLVMCRILTCNILPHQVLEGKVRDHQVKTGHGIMQLDVANKL